MKVQIKRRIHGDGRTFKPGFYELVENGIDPTPAQMTKNELAKLQANYPGWVIVANTVKRKARK